MGKIQTIIESHSIRVFMMLIWFGYTSGHTQNIYDARQSVILEASIQDNPPVIIVNWLADTANGGYTIWRKAITDQSWGDSLVILGATSTSWADTNVTVGIGYEYQVLKSLPAFPYSKGNKNTGAGYMYAGIQLPPVHHHGSCLVVIDSTFKNALSPEVLRLIADLEGDSWHAHAIYVDRNDSVQIVKSYIRAWAEENPDTHQAVFLFGRVPVPYSGDIAPDGHHSDHKGAWPSDAYYAIFDGAWTDETINNTTAASSRNDNRPGDGKFDNSKFPALAVLQVGRVDFSNMNKFPESEEQLLRRYLDKDHAWRIGKIPMEERGIVDNNFPASLEGLGQSGWRNFAPMFGIQNVKDLPYRQTLTNQSYLWSYGCGGGGPESASDISSTTNFTTDSLQTIFTMLFGSYFGDWDYPNDFLRAAIGSRTCLASTWGNRPNWLFHHMALGEHIGYSVAVTTNNRGLYTPTFYSEFVHTALMGDPTLRMHVHPPIENLMVRQAGLHVQLDWQDIVSSLGYFVYRKTTTDSTFQLLNQIPMTVTTYTDACPAEGIITYMVRSMELRSGGSGSYYNLSAGVTAFILNTPSTIEVGAEILMADAGQSNGSIALHPQGGCEPYSYSWDTGQISSYITGLSPGEYCVTIFDCLGCTQPYCATIEVSSGAHYKLPGLLTSSLYPNPAGDQVTIDLRFNSYQQLRFEIEDIYSRQVDHQTHAGNEIQFAWDISALPAGVYRMLIRTTEGILVLPFIKN
ncbi:MAG: T9SS type A sorting domain-containing protein [Saprospiraceae bacterium]|nr:T9SS type A sorting domain-containing protein [Saprospiraceae bacterium]